MFVFFCKQKTAYEVRISDWSSDVCSSDLFLEDAVEVEAAEAGGLRQIVQARHLLGLGNEAAGLGHRRGMAAAGGRGVRPAALAGPEAGRFRLDGRLVEADVLAPRLEIGRASCRGRVCQYV